MTHEERVKQVGDSIHKAYIERQVAALLPVREMAEAAIAAVFETLEVTDAMKQAAFIAYSQCIEHHEMRPSEALVKSFEAALKAMR